MHIKIDPVTTLNGVQIVVSDAVRDHWGSVTPTLDSGLVAHPVTRYLGGIIRQYLVSGGSISHTDIYKSVWARRGLLKLETNINVHIGFARTAALSHI